MVSILISDSVVAQIKWNVVNDTITLSPNVISASGSLNISKGKEGGSIIVYGSIEIALKEKAVYYNEGKDLFKFNSENLESISLNNYGTFNANDLFKKDFEDSIIQHYRRLIYPNLNLNEITFSSSKRVQYNLEESGLTLKNQKILKGKLCYLDPMNIIILTEDGELNTMQDGDFNFLGFNDFKGFYCRSFYNYIFGDFEVKLKENIESWTENIKQKDIESLISLWGPFEKMTNISADKKLITWKKNVQAYYLNITTSNNSSSLIRYNSLSNINSTTNSFYSKVSPFFLYGNSYRNTDISLSGSSITTTSSLTNLLIN